MISSSSFLSFKSAEQQDGRTSIKQSVYREILKQKTKSEVQISKIMNKIKGRSRQLKANNKYFRLIDSDIVNSKATERHPNLATLDELSKLISKEGKYLYIDLNDDKCLKFMEQCSDSEPDQETERVGNNFISQLEYSSKQNNKATAYWLQKRKDSHKTSLILDRIKGSLKRSRDRLVNSRLKNNSSFTQQVVQTQSRPQVYRGMDKDVLDRIRSKQEYEELSLMLKKRQSTLMEKYDTITTHRSKIIPATKLSIYERNSQLKLNSFLPDLSTIRSVKP